MNFSYEMTIAELVKEMNAGGSQNALYAASRATGKVIPKDVIPYLFKAAAYDYDKGMYNATNTTDEKKTIEELVPVARQLQKKAKLEKLIKEPAIVATVVEKVEKSTVNNLIESNPIGTELTKGSQEEAKTFILQALDLTIEDLMALKDVAKNKTELNGTESIYESIKQLGGRERTNKTYYVSKEVIEMAAEFCEEKSVKVSQFIEVAILEAVRKYK